tara:strand:- start:262 stop:1941 length:1680 start_codon:yes stop_codon:yes gene_type:complete
MQQNTYALLTSYLLLIAFYLILGQFFIISSPHLFNTRVDWGIHFLLINKTIIYLGLFTCIVLSCFFLRKAAGVLVFFILLQGMNWVTWPKTYFLLMTLLIIFSWSYLLSNNYYLKYNEKYHKVVALVVKKSWDWRLRNSLDYLFLSFVLFCSLSLYLYIFNYTETLTYQKYKYYFVFISCILYLSYFSIIVRLIGFFLNNCWRKRKLYFSKIICAVSLLILLQVSLVVHISLFAFHYQKLLFIWTLLFAFIVFMTNHLRYFIDGIEQEIFIVKRVGLLIDLFELTKPRLTLMVMLTTLVGVCIAPVTVNENYLIICLLGIYLIVSGACALNCFMEVDVDKKMIRTNNRALPSGRIGKKTASIFGFLLTSIGSFLLISQKAYLTAVLGFVAVVVYLLMYTPLKQKTDGAVYVGAIPGALPPLMGWVLATQYVGSMGLCLFLILFIWQLPHFMAISIFHLNDYENAHIKVYPLVKGISSTKRQIFFYTVLLVLATFLPLYLGLLNKNFTLYSLIIGLIFIGYSLKGMFIKNCDQINRRWAKNYFWGSIIYLPLLLLGMILY